MVKKEWQWVAGEQLDEHSKCKLEILRAYFARYLEVRCQPPTRKFRLAIVDGFAGGGRYECGTPGSPLIFLEELRTAAEAFNVKRAADGMPALDIGCLLILNDAGRDAIELLRERVEPLIAAAKEESSRLHLKVEYLNQSFEVAYPEIRDLLERERFRNVLFNLDQPGISHIERRMIINIMKSFPSAEVFYTFMIKSLLAFLRKSDPERLARQFAFLGPEEKVLGDLDAHMSKQEWLGAAERLVFEAFERCAKFVSPFSINNPEGWGYWLVHFANLSHRARQEYNNVLHDKSNMQAHFGRSGLHMLGFDPAHDDNQLGLFDKIARQRAIEQLTDDIPRLVTEFGDAIGVGEFYETIYNMTPAHMDDIHAAMIDSPDLEIITEAGGERRKPGTIKVSDTIRRKAQRSFSLLLSGKASKI